MGLFSPRCCLVDEWGTKCAGIINAKVMWMFLPCIYYPHISDSLTKPNANQKLYAIVLDVEDSVTVSMLCFLKDIIYLCSFRNK